MFITIHRVIVWKRSRHRWRAKNASFETVPRSFLGTSSMKSYEHFLILRVFENQEKWIEVKWNELKRWINPSLHPVYDIQILHGNRFINQRASSSRYLCDEILSHLSAPLLLSVLKFKTLTSKKHSSQKSSITFQLGIAQKWSLYGWIAENVSCSSVQKSFSDDTYLKRYWRFLLEFFQN